METPKFDEWRNSLKKINGYDILIFVLVCGLITFLIFGTLAFIDLVIPNNYPFCDYDSCSQQISYLPFNSTCFDRNNSDCTQFLTWWDYCHYQKGDRC